MWIKYYTKINIYDIILLTKKLRFYVNNIFRGEIMENIIKKSYKMFINGEWVNSSNGVTVKTYSPYNGVLEQVSKLPLRTGSSKE